MQDNNFNAGDVWLLFNRLIDKAPGSCLIIMSSLFMLLGCWQDGINLDSTTYSVIARNFSEQGNWFTPHYTTYYHSQFAEHPPLVLWVQSLIFSLFGANDTTSRLFSAVCTVGSVGLVFAIIRDVISKQAGIVAGLVLLLTYNFMQGGNGTLLDYPMAFFMLLALFGVVRMSSGKQITIGSAMLAGVGLGCAFLSKGVVAGPVWAGIALYVVVAQRGWLLNRRFWVMPLTAVGIVALYLLGDNLFADGYFMHHYFLVQLQERFVETAPDAGTVWYQFTLRMFELYLPFVFAIPIGCYLILKKKMSMLYPTLFTLSLYWLIYSRAPQLYYHYFAPMYALSAPIVAVALFVLLKRVSMSKVLTVFSIIWVALAVTVTASHVKIHHLRSPEVYHLSAQMQQFLDRREGRDGVMVRRGVPEWDTIAKTSWYWRSDLKSVHTIEEAAMFLSSYKKACYILVPKSLNLSQDQVERFELDVVTSNEQLTIYAR